MVTPNAEYRAQVRGASGWVDGGQFTRKRDAVADAKRLSKQYGKEGRILIFYAEGGYDEEGVSPNPSSGAAEC